MKADLHVHTCLSPCADLLMIPPVIEKAEVDILGIVDHNSARNALAFSKMKKLVIPGVEIQTVEDVHLLGFFVNFEDALKLTEVLYEHLPRLKHDHEKMGYQLLVNEDGDYIGYENMPLGFPANLTISQAVDLVLSFRGVPAYAHVERRFGVLYQLGFFPNLDVPVAEVVSEEGRSKAEGRFRVIVSSDAHFPDEVGRRYIELKGKPDSPKKVLDQILAGEYTLGGVLDW
ncbi:MULTISPECIES: PHP-associated domain-containing protein [Thermotoga]|uniref:PHP C-terminal domain protein n=1 Tax=Thermotoga neapolitana (strain ATCC 49049 / DSM 4359 / NBRC 107923 / NS-E) TaxID=309803 RepID=B9K8Y2_THENN|nr:MULTISPECIES: PHP-associated domain-containing protein [Thermotoga]MDK2785866.1 3,5-nucleoside bisphosphate phosphatase [Thermotoga sp.]HBF11268.1 PHP domain-containing protein [Thermotoga neapolitana]ACM23415.1 PHP C-terminal domain protein [Thermotoga neapolitana DSM 4359]AJG41325.1 phosphotransferase [Thermotoga sp. RQ7]KFZ21546.1 PHP C-terminal domain protein [Thermotoga neapolitana LA10]